jgi:hypothetical protein
MVTDNLKDDRLWAMSEFHNVAQFVSFSPGDEPKIRYSRVRDREFAASDDIANVITVVVPLWGSSVNVRSFLPGQEQGNPFYYGLVDRDAVEQTVRELASAGYYTIINETVNVADGGVSGVVHGNVVEFSPADTPRAVEKPGVVSIRRDWGLKLLEKVYGFPVDFPHGPLTRTEFSVHPKRVGFKRTHILVWETNDRFNPPTGAPIVTWPNNFSRFIGDKAFGLLLADVAGLQVPRSNVISRTIAPFIIGRTTGSAEYWLRTCPTEKRPGKFSTSFEWQDPFLLLAREDPEGDQLASVLVQEGVTPTHSGATAFDQGEHIVQGVAGRGDKFMLGQAAPMELPDSVLHDVNNTVSEASDLLGIPVHIEWVHDGRRTWIVQINPERAAASHNVLMPGSPVRGWLSFDPNDGLDELANVVDQARRDGKGINVARPVGQTSHVGDIIRAAGVPARFAN